MSDTTSDHDGTDAEHIDGLAVSDAVDRITAADDERDPETVRGALEYVAEDGVVSHEAAEDALAEASKVVATAETRAELARLALDDAREAAEPVADLPTVAARLDRFESEVSAVETQVADLGPSLQTVVGRDDDPEALYDVADGIRRVEEQSRSVQRTADDIQFDLDSFENWLTSPATRVDDLSADVDALTGSLADLDAAVDEVAAAVRDDEAATEGDAAVEVEDPAAAWFDVTLRHRVLGLTVADLRAELADLDTWAEREGVDHGVDDLAARLDALDTRHESVGERLDSLAAPAWTDRFGDRLAAAERAFGATDPPVDWSEVQATLSKHRPAVE